MATKHNLIHSIKHLLKHNRDGSYATQSDRKRILINAAKTLVDNGFKLNHLQGLKQKHIRFLNSHWQQEGLCIATCKNRNSALRWLCDKVGKKGIMPVKNEALGLGSRYYATNINKAITIDTQQWNLITDAYIKISLKLQTHFGLRREESLKIQPHLADKGDGIRLKASWCKGGKERTVPITSSEARYWLDKAKTLVKHQSNSLIPTHKTYIQQRYQYDKQLQRAGIKTPHGLRHAYAQQRYKTLTGWECPVQGGPLRKELTTIQREKDHHARQIISTELGHHRTQITVTYLGR